MDALILGVDALMMLNKQKLRELTDKDKAEKERLRRSLLSDYDNNTKSKMISLVNRHNRGLKDNETSVLRQMEVIDNPVAPTAPQSDHAATDTGSSSDSDSSEDARQNRSSTKHRLRDQHRRRRLLSTSDVSDSSEEDESVSDTSSDDGEETSPPPKTRLVKGRKRGTVSPSDTDMLSASEGETEGKKTKV